MAIYRVRPVFKGLVTDNEFGEVRVQFHVYTDSHEQMKSALEAFRGTATSLGLPDVRLFLLTTLLETGSSTCGNCHLCKFNKTLSKHSVYRTKSPTEFETHFNPIHTMMYLFGMHSPNAMLNRLFREVRAHIQIWRQLKPVEATQSDIWRIHYLYCTYPRGTKLCLGQ